MSTQFLATVAPDEFRHTVTRSIAWGAMLTIPTLLLGVLAFPDVQERTLGLLPAAVLICLIGSGFLLSRRTRLLVMLPLVASFLPSLQVGFLAYLVTLAFALLAFGANRLAAPMDAFDWAVLGVLLLSVASWLVNLGPETDLWSLPLFVVTFLAPWLLLFVARAVDWTPRELTVIAITWVALALSQVAPALIKPLVWGTPESYAVPLQLLLVGRSGLLREIVLGGTGDQTTGSMRSAHHLGAVLLLALVLLGVAWLLKRDRRLPWLMAAVGFAFLMTDAKHLVLAAMPAAALCGLPVVWPRLGGAGRRLVVAGLTVLAVVAGLWVVPRLRVLVQERLWQPYVSLARANPKVRLISRTGSSLAHHPLATWVGYGPGSFGSRAATIRASDVLFKEAQQLPGIIPPHTGDAYRAVAFDLYTSEIAASSRFRSGALTNPFSSLVGIVAEYGILGTAMMLVMLGSLAVAGYRCYREEELPVMLRAAGATVMFAVPFLLAASLFDSYFEQPDVTAPLIALGLLALTGNRSSRRLS
jgi:hypothetical protein